MGVAEPASFDTVSETIRTNHYESVKVCGFGQTHARGRVHARAQVFLSLCLRLVVAITNYERGYDPGSTVITV